MIAAVFLINVLDHFLAPLVLEVDVDVRRSARSVEMKRSNSRSCWSGSTSVMPRQ